VIAQRGLFFALDAVLLLAGWWLRPPELPRQPYYLGFLITFLVFAALLAWGGAGFPGFSASIGGGKGIMLLFLGMFALWGMFSPTWSRYPTQSATAGGQFLLVFLFAVVAACAPYPPRRAAHVLIAGALFQAVIVIAQALLQHPVGLTLFGEFELRSGFKGMSILRAGGAVWLRPYGLTIHPNVIAGYLTVGLLAMTAWLYGGESPALPRWWGIVRVLCAGVVFGALCLTFSRGAWVAFLGGMALICLAMRRRGAPRLATRRLALAGGALGVVGLLFVVGYTPFLLARAGVGGETTELRSTTDRRIFIEIAADLIAQKPLQGVGVGAFPWEARDWLLRSPYRTLQAQNVHNVPLLIAAELGLIGLGLWGGAVISGGWAGWQRARDPYAIGVAAGAAALLAIGLIDHYPHAILPMVFLAWGLMGIQTTQQGHAGRKHPPTTPTY